jgi:hypothetical protein
MCEQFHKESYLGQMFLAVEKITEYQPEVVGEVLFDDYIAPKLAHLEDLPNLQAVLVLALAHTWQVLNWKRPTDDLDKLREMVFEKTITPERYARLVVEMARALISGYSDRRPLDGAIVVVYIPDDHDFGSKRIYSTLLHLVIELSFNTILQNLHAIQGFEAGMNMWQRYFRTLAEAALVVPDSSDKVN